MNCLTVRQPWASLLILGRKTAEYRSWKLPKGRLAIHAAAKIDRYDMADVARYCVGLEVFNLGEWIETLPRGVVLGVVDVVAHLEETTRWGKWSNHVRPVVEFQDPLPTAVGRLGIWHWEA